MDAPAGPAEAECDRMCQAHLDSSNDRDELTVLRVGHVDQLPVVDVANITLDEDRSRAEALVEAAGEGRHMESVLSPGLRSFVARLCHDVAPPERPWQYQCTDRLVLRQQPALWELSVASTVP